MNNRIIIKSADEKELPVYLFEPSIAKKGAIVLIQEIFGVNDHIKAVGKKFSEKRLFGFGFNKYTIELKIILN